MTDSIPGCLKLTRKWKEYRTKHFNHNQYEDLNFRRHKSQLHQN